MTQREVAAMFNLACESDVCNESMVSNWESFVRTRGSVQAELAKRRE